MKKLLIVLMLCLMGCVGIPENVKPVDNFKIEKYLGKWYEIARLDHSFEDIGHVHWIIGLIEIATGGT